MTSIKRTAGVIAVVGLAAAASAQIEPILFSGADVPGVTGAFGGQAVIRDGNGGGMGKVEHSPDGSHWVIRVFDDVNFDYYLLGGSGTTVTTRLGELGDPNILPSTAARVGDIPERQFSINNAGTVAISGDTDNGSADGVWTLALDGTLTLIAEEQNTNFLRPAAAGAGLWGELNTKPWIANTGDVAIVDGTGDQIVALWDSTSTSTNPFELLFFENFVFPSVPDRAVQTMDRGTGNGEPGGVFYFQDPGEDPILFINADFDGLSADDAFATLRDETDGSFDLLYREGDSLPAPLDSFTITLGGGSGTSYVDANGNIFLVGAGFALLNDQPVIVAGEEVGGNVPGERWASPSGFGAVFVSGFAVNDDGGIVIAAATDNTDTFDVTCSLTSTPSTRTVTKNEVLIYIAPDGTVTELARGGDEFTVDIGNGPETRQIIDFTDTSGRYSMFFDDTHIYFLAEALPCFGTLNDNVFARVAIPTSGNPCPPDQDQNGVLDIDDFSSFVQNFFAGDSLADVNDDGGLDIDDFSDFVAFFFNSGQFPGCPS